MERSVLYVLDCVFLLWSRNTGEQFLATSLVPIWYPEWWVLLRLRLRNRTYRICHNVDDANCENFLNSIGQRKDFQYYRRQLGLDRSVVYFAGCYFSFGRSLRRLSRVRDCTNICNNRISLVLFANVLEWRLKLLCGVSGLVVGLWWYLPLSVLLTKLD